LLLFDKGLLYISSSQMQPQSNSGRHYNCTHEIYPPLNGNQLNSTEKYTPSISTGALVPLLRPLHTVFYKEPLAFRALWWR